MRGITAEMLIEVCSNVGVEPNLERLSGELLSLRTSISGVEGLLDISANGVCGSRFEKTIFDVRVHTPSSKTTSGTPPSVYRKHDVEKRDAMSNLSENLNIMGKLATKFYKRVTSMISKKKEITSYSQVDTDHHIGDRDMIA